ncbi:AAA family ATPase [Yinghuangia seranimata]|uniref:AAA family ATPase n=1 Tax=Yinghuangia seranimata TaxID=408067 RepID=UPI00248C0476|nr:AAA family ATPase [Yinghuangia seranimata]MDI2124572.1 AAA family ATPase [Yinghuangia seranimata]
MPSSDVRHPAPLRPVGVCDLRGGPSPAVLEYGPSAVLVVAGLPGSGKSTLIARCVRVPVVDSQHTRKRYQTRLPRWVPYRLVRPVVRIAHLRRLNAALRAEGPLVFHDFGAVPLVRRWVARSARRRGRDVHLLFLDVPADTALAGQRERGRAVPAQRFARHRVNARRLLGRLDADGAAPRGWASVTLLSRPSAERLQSVDFAMRATTTDL